MASTSLWSELRSLAPTQRNAVVASYLGWTLDAFDFFIMVFVLKHSSAILRCRRMAGDVHAGVGSSTSSLP